jgi:hypothetical protein
LFSHVADNPLLQVPDEKLIVTPHSICWTDECFAGIGASCVESCLAVASGQPPNLACVVDKAVAGCERACKKSDTGADLLGVSSLLSLPR